MDQVDLEALKKLAENATPGPWGILIEGDHNYVVKINDDDYITKYIGSGMSNRDLPYVAAVDPNTVLSLINHIEELRRFLKALE